MKPYKVTLYIYAESDEEANRLEKTLYDFVDAKRVQGIAVRADKITDAVTRYKDNYFVNNFLK